MKKKKIFELVFFYEDNQFSNLILLNNTQMLVYFDIEIQKIGKNYFEFFSHSAFFTIFGKILVQNM